MNYQKLIFVFPRLFKKSFLFFFFILFLSCNSQKIDNHYSYNYKILDKNTFSGYPDETWSRYDDIRKEGWSVKAIDDAKKYFDEIGSSAAILIHRGAVVFAWENVKTKYKVHSIRKSFLFSLYGIHEDKGNINLNRTIGELGINDKDGLTDIEKQAKIIDLLKCRSGIYHKAAYEAPIMEKLRPARGSHKPGEFYYYNNWDFNVLGVIFEQETNTKIFEEFNKCIAIPIEMENFNLSDCKYVYGSEKSIHPAYPFKMNTNDMARFGLLYLNNGKWRDEQIIPETWIKKSTAIYSHSRGYGVGFKWANLMFGALNKFGTYQTSGYRGHRIIVIPKLNMVFVHRVDTYSSNINVSQKKIEKLLEKILRAYKHTDDTIVKKEQIAIKVNPKIYDSYIGQYEVDPCFSITIFREKHQLFSKISDQYKREIYPKSETEYFFKEIDAQITFVKNKDNQVTHLVFQQKGDHIAKKISRISIHVDPKIYDSYIGQYEFEFKPGYIFTVTKKKNKLFIKPPGEKRVEIYPESESNYFCKVDYGTVSFVKNENSKVTHLIIHRCNDYLAKKMH